jgi:hypothetical protein
MSAIKYRKVGLASMGKDSKKYITKLHIDIPKVVEHWPWKNWGMK